MKTPRTEALEMAYEMGHLSMSSDASLANHFDCPESDARDALENACQNCNALCDAAGVTEQERADAYANGQRGTGSAL